MIKKIRESLTIAFSFMSIGLFSAANLEELSGIKSVGTAVESPLPSITISHRTSSSGSSKRSQSPKRRSPSAGLSKEDLVNSIAQIVEGKNPIENVAGKDLTPIESIEQNDDDKAKAVGCMCMRKK